MEELYEVEGFMPFANSKIWELNREYYHEEGLEAWRDGTVPHQMTSSSMLGKTYAKLIFATLKDLATKEKTQEKVYILELGAGHGRLAFHVLRHLDEFCLQTNLNLPSYCYILSDIAEKNLQFFSEHPQFQTYLEQGKLDVAYFDAIGSNRLELRHSKLIIEPNSLNQPLLAIANYFFDTIPSDIFHFKNKVASSCEVALKSKVNPAELNEASLLDNLQLTFENKRLDQPFFKEKSLNRLIETYKELLNETHIFFPSAGIRCIQNLESISKEGLMLLTMDKGFLDLKDLEGKGEPEIIHHGSFSIWVNFHGLKMYCDQQGGKTYFPSYATFHSQVGCLLFLKNDEKYHEVHATYQRAVNDFGPDDFNSLKRMAYKQLARMDLIEVLSMLRLGDYDSTLFKNFLPRIKQNIRRVTVNERRRLAQTLNKAWNMYFSINEEFDMAYEIGGLFYDLGFYKEALVYFEYSVALFGKKPDIYYNEILCHYQLREDKLFVSTLEQAMKDFPKYERFKQLAALDLGA